MKTLIKNFFIVLTLFLLTNSSGRAIHFVFDYSYDTSGFFTPQRRDIVQMAANELVNLTFQRDAIIPSGSNQWTWKFSHPSSGNITSIHNPTAPSNQVTVFLGAYNLGSGILGLGGVIGRTLQGNMSWINKINDTNTTTAFKPIAGTISINNFIDWYDGIDSNIPSGKFDLYSVISHELGHVLGFGLSTVKAWGSRISGDRFMGTKTLELVPSGVPLTSDKVHIEQTYTYEGQQTMMSPFLSPGTRTTWTAVEFAMFQDLGYTLIPEPSTLTLTLIAIAILFHRRNNMVRERKKI